MPRRVRIVLVVLAAMASAAPLAAQASARWIFRSSSSADLWFHGVALTGFTGFGTQPLYDPGHAATVRRAREARGVPATRLEREADAFRAAFVADSAFELLHFIPLYFAAVEPADLLDALDAVARAGTAAVATVPPRARFGASTVAAVLASPAQRATLGRFVAALREEWGTFREERASAAAARTAQLSAATSAWERIEPALRTALAADRLDGGVIMAVPALGPEGRLFAGRPDDRGDNVIAVALPSGAEGDVAAWLAVKELSFPDARRRLTEARVLPADRVEAERMTGAAAAELGARRLEPASRDLAARYRASVATAAGCGTFDGCFRLPEAARAALTTTP